MPILNGNPLLQPRSLYKPLKKNEKRLITLPGYETMPLLYDQSYPYKNNYAKLAALLVDQTQKPDDWYRELIRTDLFFLTYFHLRIKKANHPFVIERCAQVDREGTTGYEDLWARGHFKSTILTTAYPIQRILNNPEERICIFSFRREAAMGFYLPIKELLEKDTTLHRLFPDILTSELREYPLWTRDLGLTVMRKGFYREPTLMFSGFLEGLPTGKHFTGKVFDDVMTADMAQSPSDIERSKVMFGMAQNLTDNDTGHDRTEWEVFAGTPYHYNDITQHLKDQKNHDGTPAYTVRLFPATDDGTADGRPVLLTQEALDKLKRDKDAFATQQLLNPVPIKDRRLSKERLIEVTKDQLPKNLFQFLLVDPAGDKENQKKKTTKGDNWAIGLLGVEPVRDSLGQSNIYILDLVIRDMSLESAMETISTMFFGSLSRGRIRQIGLEKTGISTYEYHISGQMKKYKRLMTVKNKGIHLLRPGIQNKVQRIGTALEVPMNAGKWHVLDSVPSQYLNILKQEMDHFPRGSDDGIDMISYIYDLIASFQFPERYVDTVVWQKPNDLWLDESEVGRHSVSERPWML